MAELSSVDIKLLSASLPELRHTAVESSLYPHHRGLIEYRSAGDHEKPVVLCLHGLGSSSDGYRAQLAGLLADFHVVAWNAPGFGASSQIEAGDIHIDDYATALEAFLQASKIERSLHWWEARGAASSQSPSQRGVPNWSRASFSRPQAGRGAI
ncbi:alpha/beta fold hydrolase [Bradyrhizobium tunisiense]|uniref:alpha/beta fold hydrolase n=1 Tax=Bradyrhizobium tunisiense TaxID=3278709 RepID=UPI0035D81C83